MNWSNQVDSTHMFFVFFVYIQVTVVASSELILRTQLLADSFLCIFDLSWTLESSNEDDRRDVFVSTLDNNFLSQSWDISNLYHFVEWLFYRTPSNGRYKHHYDL